MALKLRESVNNKFKFATIFVAVLALAVQPMYGLMSARIANAEAGELSAPAVEFKTESGVTLAPGMTTNEKKYTFKLSASDVTEQSYFNLRLSVDGTSYQKNVQKLNGTGNPKIGTGSFHSGDLAVLGDGSFNYPANGGQGTYIAEFQVCKTAADCSPYTQPVSVTYDASYVDTPADTTGPEVTIHSSSPKNNDYLSGVRYTREGRSDEQRNRIILNVADASGVKKVALYITNHATGVKVKEYAMIQHNTNTEQWYADVDTTKFDNGVYDIAARAVDNENNASYFNNRRTDYRVTIDNTAPKISVIEGSQFTVGKTSAKTFSKVSFKLSDNTKFEGKYSINGVDSTVGSSNWGDANYIKVGQRGAVYGENTITLRDLAGNSTSYTFTLDNKAPTISVKDGYVGNESDKVFSNVSFKLYDKNSVDYAVVNGWTLPLTDNDWSDADFGAIKNHLNLGNNTITLFDIAGNSATYEFAYDNVKPTIAGFDLQNLVNGQFNPSKVVAHASDDDTFVTSVSIDTYKKQADGTWKYTYSPFVQGTPMGNERNFAEFKSSDARINTDGTYKLVAWAVDKAGNVSEKTESSEFTVDTAAPNISWQRQPLSFYGIGAGFHVRPITSEVGTVKSVYIDEINSANLIRTLSSDHKNFDTSNASNQTLWDSLSDGVHKFIAVFEDFAGNKTISESDSFTTDRIAPEGDFTYSNSKAPTNGNVIAYLTTKEPVTISSGWTQSDSNVLKFTHKFTKNGSYDAVITDAAGNSTTLTASVDWIDKSAPSVTKYEYSNNGNLTNKSVTVTITTSEPVKTPAGWTGDEGDTKFTKEFSENGGFEVTLTDMVENTATVGGKSQGAEVKRIDKNSPVISGITDGSTVSGAVNLSILDPKYEGFDGFNKSNGLSINGHTVAATEGPSKTFLYEVTGDDDYTVVATDKAGNVSETLHFTIDTTAPLLTVVEDNGSNTQSIHGTTDSADDVVTVNGSTDGVVVKQTQNADGTYDWTYTPSSPFPVGTTQLAIRSTDDAGNYTADTRDVVVVASQTPKDKDSNGTENNNSDSSNTANRNGGNTSAPDNAGPTVTVTPAGDQTTGTVDTDGEVAGASTQAGNGEDVKGAATSNSDKAGWNMLGLAWYWWLVLVAAIAAFWWFLAAKKRRAEEQA